MSCFQRVGDRLDVFAAVRADLPGHLEIVFGIDRPVLGRQVAHMAVGRQNGVIGPEILVDCLGFGRGFNNNDRHLDKHPHGADIGAVYGGRTMWGRKRRYVNPPHVLRCSLTAEAPLSGAAFGAAQAARDSRPPA